MTDWLTITFLSWQIRRADQARLMVITSCLGTIGLFMVLSMSFQNRLVDFDQAAIDPAQTPTYQVDLNHCQWFELVVLPGIGETLAQSIVAYRLQNGPFTSTDQIQNVRGIGPARYQQLAPFLNPIDPTTINVPDPLESH